MKKFILLLLVNCFMAYNLSAQFDTTTALYDFNLLSNGNMNGQDGWITTKWNTNIDIQVADTGYDGTKAVYFNQVGPSVGCDGSKAMDTVTFPGFAFTTDATYILTFEVKKSYWGIDFGLAADLNQNGVVTKNDANEKALIFNTSSFNADKLTLPNGTVINYFVNNNNWMIYEITLSQINTMPGGRLTLRAKQLGTTVWTTLSNNINAGLDTTVATKQNPFLWDMLYMHHEGGTSYFDNISFTKITPSSTTGINTVEVIQLQFYTSAHTLFLRNVYSGLIPYTVYLFDMKGQQVFETVLRGNEHEAAFNLDYLKPGMYVCRVTSGNNTFHKKVSISR